MFDTTKSRLAVVASSLWIVGAMLMPDEYSPSRWWSTYFISLFSGWFVIWLSIYGAYWVVDAPKGSIKPIMLPRWLTYVLLFALFLVLVSAAKTLKYVFH